MDAYIQHVLDELDHIKGELGNITDSILDKDMFLTCEDAMLLEKKLF